NAGFLTVAHAGEEGPPEYIHEALNYLHVRRIDHGVRCLEDELLTQRLLEQQIPLTVCPLSNVKLNVFDKLIHHPLKKMLDKWLLVTINSDDPAYFGGYLNENFYGIVDALGLNKSDIDRLVRNSIQGSFLDEIEKQNLLDEIEELQ